MRALIPVYVKMQNRLHTVLENEEGATMVEYALMIALIAAVAITAVTLVGTNVTAEFNKVAGLIK